MFPRKAAAQDQEVKGALSHVIPGSQTHNGTLLGSMGHYIAHNSAAFKSNFSKGGSHEISVDFVRMSAAYYLAKPPTTNSGPLYTILAVSILDTTMLSINPIEYRYYLY